MREFVFIVFNIAGCTVTIETPVTVVAEVFIGFW
jgi:hypothetical protein